MRTPYTPTRLLHVGSSERDPFLVETNDQDKGCGNYCDYVALSHCWGRHPLVTTTKNTLLSHKAGVVWNQLSKTFQDAIILTRALGIDFIWIDSLCIVQDDAEDWAKEASQMASIYRNGHITIAATWAASGENGFLNDRKLPQVYKFLSEGENGKTYHFSARNVFDHTAFRRPLSGDGADRPLPLLTRGWCLQEQILSPHTVHFTSEELVWECHEGTECECNPEDPGPKIKTDVGKALTGASPAELSEAWRRILENFCQRRLTFRKDRLPALSGIAGDFEKHQAMGRYLAGHWERDLPFSLLWVSKRSLGRRETTTALSPLSTRPPTPSWSWASLEAIDMSWQRWKPQLESEVQILEASCSPGTADPRGQVAEGHITFRGQVFEVKLAHDDDQNQNGHIELEHCRSFATDEQGNDASESPVKCHCQADTDPMQKPNTDEVLLFLVLASTMGSGSTKRSLSGLFLLATDNPACPEVRKLKSQTKCDYIAVRIGAGAANSAVDYTTSTVRTVTVM